LSQTYLAGESFAGQYIPYFGESVTGLVFASFHPFVSALQSAIGSQWLTHLADALIKTTLLPDLQFKGIAIGNGWIDPMQQYTGYADFAYEKGLIKPGTPVSRSSHVCIVHPAPGLHKVAAGILGRGVCSGLRDLRGGALTHR
jgi:carboxypeptidase D